MASLNLDFSNVPSREPITEGIYEVMISKVEQVMSKTNKPMLKVEFDVQDPDYQGRKLFTNYVMTPDCMWKLKELCSSLGLDTDQILEMDDQELVGMTCSAKVGQKEYNGEIQNEIKKTM